MLDNNLLRRIDNLTDEKLSEDCLKVLRNTKNGSSIINFRYTPLEVVELYELMDRLGLSKSAIIKGALKVYKRGYNSAFKTTNS